MTSVARPQLANPDRPGIAPDLTVQRVLCILGAVMNWLRRLSTLAVVLALGAGNAAVCAGWLPTPEARMACCAEGGGCPMHKGESSRSGSFRVITQAQADSCCASSERESSNQSNPSFVASITPAVLGTGVIIP